MSMPLGFATRVSFASMRRRWIRTSLSLIPCVLLIAVLFVGATIPNGLVSEIDEKILKSAESRQEIVNLDSYLFAQQESFGGTGTSVNYNKKLYDLATRAPQVEDVYPQYGNTQAHIAKLGNIEHVDMPISGNNQEFAKLYTGENFTYKKGQPIPLLLNPANLGSEHFTFDKTGKFQADYSSPKSFDGKLEFRVLKDAQKLVGTTITANANQFSLEPGVIEEYGSSGSNVTIKKVTKTDIAALDRGLRQQFSPYWNVDQLKKPLEVKFKVVGLIKDQAGFETRAYIPNEAAADLFNQQYQLQKNARSSTAIPSEFLTSLESKVELKNGKLITGAQYVPASYKISKSPEETLENLSLSPASINGLVVEGVKLETGQGFKEANISQIKATNFNPAGAVVKLKAADQREEYVEYLKKNGIEISDQSPVSVIKTIRSWSNKIVTWLTIILGSITALILLTTMGRFVADSRREIGVWRAIGATKLDIKKLVWTRMAWLLIIAIGVGIVIGFGVSLYLAGLISSNVNEATSSFNPYAAESFVGSIIISFLGGEVPMFSKLGLLATDWYLLLTRLGLLSLIAMFFCMLPARKASRISPIVAIRDSE